MDEGGDRPSAVRQAADLISSIVRSRREMRGIPVASARRCDGTKIRDERRGNGGGRGTSAGSGSREGGEGGTTVAVAGEEGEEGETAGAGDGEEGGEGGTAGAGAEGGEGGMAGVEGGTAAWSTEGGAAHSWDSMKDTWKELTTLWDARW